MTILEKKPGEWVIMHAGKEIAEDFASENDAYQWADRNIDDQVFDAPNHFSPALKYRQSTVAS